MKEQKQVTCHYEDWQTILKLKKYFKAHNTNEVIREILFSYLNSGNIDEEDKIKLLGAKLYEMYCR